MTAATKPETTAVIPVDGQLVKEYRHCFKQKALDALAKGAKLIVVDCERSGYIDSTGLGVLVSIAFACRKNGARILLAAVQPETADLLKVTKLNELFQIVESVESARA